MDLSEKYAIKIQVSVGYDGMAAILYNTAYSKVNCNTLYKVDDDSLMFRME